GSIFSKKQPKAASVTEQDRAVLQLKHQRDELKKYQRRVENHMKADKAAAKQLLDAGRKDKALLLLRKKKRQETLLEKADQQLDNLERLVQDIEFAQVQSQVVAGLEAGNKALKELNAFLSLERVEAVLDETQEAVEYQRQVDALLSGGKLTEDDENECEAELDALLAQTETETAKLPSVPTDQLPDQAEDVAAGQKQKPRSEAKKREAVPAS
ncbi:hypothetical protein BOX15_Mlig015664g1, partial [Macrostomum lignano]